jgi:hypothetical protein
MDELLGPAANVVSGAKSTRTPRVPESRAGGILASGGGLRRWTVRADGW